MRSSRPSGQALVEFALVTPLLLFIILGGTAVGLLVVNRVELQHAAQEAAVAGAQKNGCTGALGAVPQVLGYEPDDKSCRETGQIVEVTLFQRSQRLAPIPIPDITVTGRAVIREVEPSASPEAELTNP